MIDFISMWAKQIVVAVIIATIIEMIVPNGNSKKYIKTIIGIFILFNIITPIIDKITNGSLNIDSIVNIEEYAKQMEMKENEFTNFEVNNSSNIKDIYLYNLKRDIKSKIESKECIVNNIDINIDENNEYKIKKIELDLKKDKQIENNKESEQNTNQIVINKIEEVNINIKNEKKEDKNTLRSLNNKEKSEIKEYLSSTYDINSRNIIIN